MSKKKRKPFLYTRLGRLIVTFIAIGIAAIFVLSLIPGNTSNSDRAEDEWKEVLGGLQLMWDSAVPPITDLQSDERISAFAGKESDATSDMTDGGLIDIVDAFIESGSITPLNVILKLDSTRYQYWVEPDGTLRQSR